MKIHNILLKIGYWLVALSILVIIGLTFFTRRILSEQSQKPAVENTEQEEVTNIKFSGVTVVRADKAKKDEDGTKEAAKKDEGPQTEQPGKN